MVAFEIPTNPLPSRNFQGEYDGLLRDVNAVSHGEFERAVNSLLEQAATKDQGGIARRRWQYSAAEGGGRLLCLMLLPPCCSKIAELQIAV
jgi:hypothetical protein